jgi:hypothetical protein
VNEDKVAVNEDKVAAELAQLRRSVERLTGVVLRLARALSLEGPDADVVSLSQKLSHRAVATDPATGQLATPGRDSEPKRGGRD